MQTCRLTGKRGKQCCKMIFKLSTSLDFMSFDSFKSIIIFTSLYTFFSLSRTSHYGHLSNTDTCLLHTVSNVLTKFSYNYFL